MRFFLLGLLAVLPMASFATSEGWENCPPLRWEGGPLAVEAWGGELDDGRLETLARWYDGDRTHLLEGQPYKCIVLLWSLGESREGDEQQRALALAEAARLRQAGLTVLASVAVGEQALEAAVQAAPHFDGVVLEGALSTEEQSRLRDAVQAAAESVSVISLGDWSSPDPGPGAPVLGAADGSWPGLLTPSDAAGWEAGPTSEPWTLTNHWRALGLSSGDDRPVWLGHRPVRRRPQPLELAHWKRAVADAALGRARWIVAPDTDLLVRLADGDSAALREWEELGDWVRFLEERRKDWAAFDPWPGVALVRSPPAIGLFGGPETLHALAVKQIVPRFVAPSELAAALARRRIRILADDVAPSGADDREALDAFVGSGGVLIAGPRLTAEVAADAGADSPAPAGAGERIVFSESDFNAEHFAWEIRNKLDDRNLRPRLFNVGTVASLFSLERDSDRALLELVEYADYPTENVTARLPRKFDRAVLYSFGFEPEELEIYPAESGPGVEIEIPEVDGYCAVVLE